MALGKTDNWYVIIGFALFLLVLSIPSFAATWTETTNADFWDGFFYGSTMNQSNSLRMTGNFTAWRKESTNPVFSNSTGNTWDNFSSMPISTIWDSDDSLYKLYFQGNNDTSDNSWKNGLATSPNGTIFDRHDFNPIMDIGTGWESVWVDGPQVIRHNSTFYEKWYNGYDGSNYQIGYANSTNGTNWTKDGSNPVVTASSPINTGCNNAGEKTVWIEGNTYFMLYVVDCSPYRIYLINSTDGRTWQGMNAGDHVMSGADIGTAEIQATGLIRFRYNSTDDIYYMVLGYWQSDQSYTLVWSFNKINWTYWDSGANVLSRGGSGQWDDLRVNWGGFVTDRNGYLLQKSGDNDLLFYYTGQKSGYNWYRTGLAYPNYTWATYESNINDIGSIVNITEVSWTNTTCSGCDVKIQVGNSTDGSTFNWSSNYTSSPQALNLNASYIQYRLWLIGNDTFYTSLDDITITYSGGDEAEPTWSNNQSSTPTNYSPTTLSEFNITWTDNIDIDTVLIEQNWTSPASNLTMTNDTYDGSIYNYSNVLPAGTYYWKSYANDTSNNWNGSDTWAFTINNGTNILIYNITNRTDTYTADSWWDSWVNIGYDIIETYPNPTTVSASCFGGTEELLRNGTNADSENGVSLVRGVNYYNYSHFCYGNQNYSSNKSTNGLTIMQNTTPLSITFNTSSTVTEGTIVNITGDYPAELTDTKLYNDTGDEVTNPNIYDTTGLSGDYNFTFNTSGNVNYSSYSTSQILTVVQQGSLIIYRDYEETNITNNITFNVTISNTTTSETNYNIYTYQNNTVRGDLTIEYWANDYPRRKRFQLISLTGFTNISIYSLGSSDGHLVSFYIVDTSESPIENVLVTARRLIGSVWYVVDQERSDSSGVAQLFLQSTASYELFFNRTGYSDVNSTSTPSESAYKVYMTSTTGYTGNYTPTMWENLTMVITPQGGAVRNQSTTFNYTVVSTDSLLEWWGMNLTWGNGTNFYSNNTTTVAGGIMTYTIDLSNEVGSNISMEVWFKKQGFDAYIDPRIYFVQGFVEEGVYYILNTLAGAIDPFSLGIIALFISMLAAGFVSTKLAFATKLGGGVVMLGVLAIFTYFFEATLWGWLVWTFAAISVASLLYLKGGW